MIQNKIPSVGRYNPNNPSEVRKKRRFRSLMEEEIKEEGAKGKHLTILSFPQPK